MTVPPVLTPTSRLQFGFSQTDITPPADTYHRLWGAARQDQATGIHRPLRASVAALAPLHDETGAERRLLVALDLCLLRPPEMDALRESVERLAGVPRDRIAFTFSHTHASGNFSRGRSHLPGGERIGPYLDRLPSLVADAIEAAVQATQPCTMTFGAGVCAMGHHRDFPDVSRGIYVCGFNPETPPGLPLQVVRVTNDSGETRAIIVNYGCHPTTLAWENSLISPDYVGMLRDTVESATGAPCLFLLAPCGDVGPRHGFVGEVAVADRNGRQLALAALSVLESLPPDQTDFHYDGPVLSGATLGAWSFRPQSEERLAQATRFEHRSIVVPLPYLPDNPTVEEAESRLRQASASEEEARAAGEEARAAHHRAMAERHTRLLERLRPLPEGPNYPFAVSLWRLGDAVWIAVEGEPYQELQVELSRRFPKLAMTFAVLSDGARPSYLPPRHDYGKPLYQAEIAVLAPGCLERLTDAIASEIQSLFPDRTDD